jgi:hypothetical protein
MTTPTGRLAYGQAGTYDAIDDRVVIAAVTGYRTGMVGTVQAQAGAGLNIVIAGGWLGVADCGDGTSAVVGSVTEEVVQANPGPPTGTREDFIWCDVDPDAGTWQLNVIPASTSAGRPGLPVASITVPANATLAASMTIRPAGAFLERRLLAWAGRSEENTRTGQTWETVGTCISADATALPGHWYRARFTATSPMITSGGQNQLRIGIGHYPRGGNDATAQRMRGAVIGLSTNYGADASSVEYVFQHPPTAAPVDRTWIGRIWIAGPGQFRTCGVIEQGDALVLTVEDLGT